MDIFVAGVDTGGTLTGVSRYLKQTRTKNILPVAVEPGSSPVMTQKRAGLALQPGPHKIQGIGTSFIPDVVDMSLIDQIEQVSNKDAILFAQRMAGEEGILCEISCRAAVAVAVRIANLPEHAGKIIVVVLPEPGERYLSSILFEGLYDASGGAV